VSRPCAEAVQLLKQEERLEFVALAERKTPFP
jgi:hypothetical protein